MSPYRDYDEESLPRRRIGWGTRLVMLMVVIALIGGSAAGMWATMTSYFSSSRIGWDGLIQRGDEALMANDYEQAVQFYLQAIDLEPQNPGNASVYAGIGTAQYYSGNMAAALQSFQRALDLDSQHWGALYSSGVIYHYYVQDYAEAAEIWETLLDMEWNDTVIEEHIGELLAEAKANLQQVR